MLVRSRPAFQQGNLDGLCGVYAIINALRWLCPELDRTLAKALFAELVGELRHTGDDPLTVVASGMETATLRQLLVKARGYVDFELGVAVSARPLPGHRALTSVDRLWRALTHELRHGRVVILPAYGRHDHWSVAAAITGRGIGLYDSQDLRTLLRSHCSVGRPHKLHHLVPADCTVLFRRRG